MEHTYTNLEIKDRFESAIGKTLGQIDKVGDFERTKTNPKITGIAGDVVEHSILGYASDTKQEADIKIDGKDIEVKTTGVRGKYKEPKTYTAKERITITNVSPKAIAEEKFESSALWDKLENTLLAYYLYDNAKPVPAAEYASFPFLGYQLHSFSEADKKIIMKDWQLVRDFCAELTEVDKKSDEQAKAYSAAKKDMMYLETAPGWKNGPRFALRKSYVNSIIQEHFGAQSTGLSEELTSYSELDQFLAKNSKRYKNRTVAEISAELGVKQSSKSVAHSLITKILNPESDIKKGEEQFDLIKKSGLVVKVFVVRQGGKKKENCKFITIDFSELNQSIIDVHETDIYEYFSNTQFLFAIFEDGGKDGQLDDVFQGFKRFSFDEQYLESYLVPVLERVNHLLVDKTLVEKPHIKPDGTPVINKTGVARMTNNLPKSTEGKFFLNGTGSDSNNKPLKLNGFSFYYQQMWLRGDEMIKLLDEKNTYK
ncbi:MutH/Sau3AI family endonuclease [Fructobacillus cardui]|uniref:MutH/Sau3AI family endonuclease n=1 Tax=Fructobacillus cardui TaxID=2893170 RepID=UPI002D86F31A|nr:hypothetical protein R53653_IHELHDKM_01416 [Fructobacillus cardui]